MPEAPRLWSPFPLQVRHSVSDGYAANTKAEHGLQELMPTFVKNRVFCSVHRLATALGSALDLDKEHISGVLATGLACASTGSARTLRNILACIFEESLEIVYDEPPEHAKCHRQQVYDRFLPVGSSASNARVRR